MNHRDIYPLFVTGPFLECESDRSKMIKILNDSGMKTFAPEELLTLSNRTPINTITFISQFLERNTFAFENVLGEISGSNIMFPHTSSSIYELGHLNNLYKGETKVFIPKKVFVFSKGTFERKTGELGQYIKINHRNSMNYYPQDISGNNNFPNAHRNWLEINSWALSKKYAKRKIVFSVRSLQENNSINRSKFAHILSDFSNTNTIHVPIKLAYSFFADLRKKLKEECNYDLRGKENLNHLAHKIKNLLLETLQTFYESEEFGKPNIALFIPGLGSRYTEKELFLGLFLISIVTKITKIPSKNLLKQQSQNAYSFIEIKGRKLQMYSSNEKGDTLHLKHKKLLEKWQLMEILKPSSAATAYRSEESWITNVKRHIPVIYGNKDSSVLKLDISNFFNSITIENLRRSKYAIEEFAELSENDLKQGTVLAPFLSNVFLKEFDEKIISASSELGLTYSRYSDDMFFSTPNKFEHLKKIREIVECELRKINLALNDEKEVLAQRGQFQDLKLTGVVLKNEFAKIPTRLSKKMVKWARFPASFKMSKKYIKSLMEQLNQSEIKMNEGARKLIIDIIKKR